MKFSANTLIRLFSVSALSLGTVASILTASLPASASMHDREGGWDRDRGGWDRGDRGGGWDRGGDRGGWGRPPGPGPGPRPGPRPRPPGPNPGPYPPNPGRYPPGPYPPGPAPMPPPAPAPLNNIHRFASYQDHLMTLDPNEGYRAGFRYEGIAFRAFAYPSAGVMKAPIYRCFVYGSAHFVSRDPNCEGQIQEGLLGYVAVQRSYEAQTELVRCSGPVDHLVTANIQECYNAGYRIEGVIGYVP